MKEDDFYDRVNDYGDGKEDGGRHEGGFDKPCHTEKIGDSMSAETKILTDEQIDTISKAIEFECDYGMDYQRDFDDMAFARAIEQAVLNSPEIRALRKDAERLDFIEQNWFWRSQEGEILFVFNEMWDAGKHDDLRAAIDDEMKEQQP